MKDGTSKDFGGRCNYIKPFCNDQFITFINLDYKTNNEENLEFVNVTEIKSIVRWPQNKDIV
jgi:hypothetical protein